MDVREAGQITWSFSTVFNFSGESYRCFGCKEVHNIGEFKVNKGRWTEYCKSCQRILGHSAMKHRYTLQSKLDEIKVVLNGQES